MRRYFTALLAAALLAATILSPLRLRAADNDLPFYFEGATLIVHTQTINRIQYLPLADLARQLNLSMTNDAAQEILTLRNATSQIVLTRNSAAISVNNQITALANPVLHESGVWLVPPEFLQQGLQRVSGVDFRRKAGAPRIFAGAVKPATLAINAQSQGSLTRLTLRTSTPVTLDIQRDNAQHRAVLVFAPKPIDPARESVEYKDRLVQAIAFNDSDGSPKLVVDLSDDVSDIRTTATDENRIHFVDFVRKTETAEPPPAPAPVPSTSAPPPAPAPAVRPANTPIGRTGGIRVVVIDPGHGGTDAGVSSTGALEKDLTLALARKLRSTLQSRLGATVLLTRDSDVQLTGEARAAVANNNQADFFISLHIGYSPNKADYASSLYVIQENFAAGPSAAEKGQRLFLPWYLGYRNNREASVQAATILSEDLDHSIPGWNFPVRTGPVGVLSSTTMPSVLLEVGNLNNPASALVLLDSVFQNKLTATVANAIERFSASRQADK